MRNHPKYDLSCPRCNAAPHVAILTVVEGRFEDSDVRLTEYGFDLHNATSIDTSDEIVACCECGKQFPLEECLWSNRAVNRHKVAVADYVRLLGDFIRARPKADVSVLADALQTLLNDLTRKE